MSLSTEQINLISFIDQKAKKVLSSSGDGVSLMIALLDKMPEVKIMINSATKEELDKCCNLYEGFYQYMKILEATAGAIANSRIKVPKL